MSSLKLRVLPAPSVQEACLHPSMFVQKTRACAEGPLRLLLCSPDPSQSQYCSFKSLGAKEFESETHRTMGTAKGQGLQPVQLCPGRDGHPAWHAGGVGNQIFPSSPDPHWSESPLCEIGQKPGEITAFPTQVLWPCLGFLCWGQVWPQPGCSSDGLRQGKVLMCLARWR